MTRYETIQSQQENILTLINKKFIPIHILDWKVYYEAYVQEMELLKNNFSKPTKEEAIQSVMIRYDLSRKTVFNIINFMES